MPLTPSTKNLFGEAAFAKIKKGARVINVARGGVIDEDALVKALDAGQVRKLSYGLQLRCGLACYYSMAGRAGGGGVWLTRTRLVKARIGQSRRRYRGGEREGLLAEPASPWASTPASLTNAPVRTAAGLDSPRRLLRPRWTCSARSRPSLRATS